MLSFSLRTTIDCGIIWRRRSLAVARGATIAWRLVGRTPSRRSSSISAAKTRTCTEQPRSRSINSPETQTTASPCTKQESLSCCFEWWDLTTRRCRKLQRDASATSEDSHSPTRNQDTDNESSLPSDSPEFPRIPLTAPVLLSLPFQIPNSPSP